MISPREIAPTFPMSSQTPSLYEQHPPYFVRRKPSGDPPDRLFSLRTPHRGLRNLLRYFLSSASIGGVFSAVLLGQKPCQVSAGDERDVPHRKVLEDARGLRREAAGDLITVRETRRTKLWYRLKAFCGENSKDCLSYTDT